MFNLFTKSKVRAGKSSEPEKTDKQEAQPSAAKKGTPLVALSGAWAKLNKMDRKQAYTWGALAVVGMIALMTLGSAMSASDGENFEDYESRGYDLANMPFSTDEAEQYLLAAKYPDMKQNKPEGLYSQEEKEARQAEDALEAQEAQALKQAVSSASRDSGYRGGRYLGGSGRGGRGGTGMTTKVGQLGNASVKGASGSGLSGSFGPSGDFSNFRSQDKGHDKFNPQQNNTSSGNARQALYQTRAGSRAAAGLKNDKLANAKKAMMGGKIEGSGAFMDDSGAVDLSEVKGLALDENAPVSSTDLSGLDESLEEAKKDAQDKANDEEKVGFWKSLWQEFVRGVSTMVLDIGKSVASQYINQALFQQKTWGEYGSCMEYNKDTPANCASFKPTKPGGSK